ncbi:hypothetical protein DOS81_02575, partial [Staphylococcus felis]
IQMMMETAYQIKTILITKTDRTKETLKISIHGQISKSNIRQ